MQPFNIQPPADYPRDNVIPMAAARPRGRSPGSRSVRAIRPAPRALVEQVRREDAALNGRDPDEAYRDAILEEVGGVVGAIILVLVAAGIGAMLALGSAF